MNCRAASRFSGVAGFGSGQRTDVLPAKVMTLKVSPSRMASIDRETTALLFSIGKPLMEPDVSRTKTSSRRRISFDSTRAGGAITMLRYPPGTLAESTGVSGTMSVKIPGATWVNTLSVIASSFSRQRSTKSRLGISRRFASEMLIRPGPSRVSTTSCNGASIEVIGMPPVSTRTLIAMSWPARIGGRTGIGVIRSASGTWSVGSANPPPGS